MRPEFVEQRIPDRVQSLAEIRLDARAVTDQLDHATDDGELRTHGVDLIDERGKRTHISSAVSKMGVGTVPALTPFLPFPPMSAILANVAEIG